MFLRIKQGFGRLQEPNYFFWRYCKSSIILNKRGMNMWSEKAGDKNGRIAYKGIKITFGVAPILKFEKRSFGWHYEGRRVYTVDEGYEATYHEYSDSVTVEHKTSVIETVYFSRPRVYPKHPLFVITELLSRFVSLFRRWYIAALPLVIIISLLVLWLADPESKKTVITVFVSLYVAFIGASIGLAFLGRLWRRLFQLDDACDNILSSSGYKKWSDTDEGDHF